MEAEITKATMLSMQVCVPTGWSDAEVVATAERHNPCGTTGGWQVRREDGEGWGGYPERNPCAKRAGYVHVMLDA